MKKNILFALALGAALSTSFGTALAVTPSEVDTLNYYTDVNAEPVYVATPGADPNCHNGFYTTPGGARAYQKAHFDGEAWEIGNGGQLFWYAKYFNKGTDVDRQATVRLTADIYSECELNGPRWTPIGSDNNPFKGTFDGQGHFIDHITYYGMNTSPYAGLFAVANGATFRNIILTRPVLGTIGPAGSGNPANDVYAGTGITGGIAARASNSRFENCVVSRGNEYAKDAGYTKDDGGRLISPGYVGGICGASHNVTFENCGCSAYISIFQHRYSREHYVCAFGSITGIVTGNLTVRNCYGISSTLLFSDYHAMWWLDLSNTADYFRYTALIGTDISDTFTLENNFDEDGGVDTGEMCYRLNHSDPNGPWRQNLGEDSHPVPATVSGHAPVYGFTFGNQTYYNNSKIDLTDRVLTIHNASELYVLQCICDKNDISTSVDRVVLANDIDMSELEVTWTGIGCNSHPFNVEFDGQGHTIRNLTYKGIDSRRGLFGHIATGAVVKNFTVYGDMTVGRHSIGVVGYNNGGTVSDVKSNLNITVIDMSNEYNGYQYQVGYIGGIVGENIKGDIVRCSYYGTLDGGTKVYTDLGGICGKMADGSISDCRFCGTVKSDFKTCHPAGICGSYNSNSSTLNHCLSVGKVINTANANDTYAICRYGANVKSGLYATNYWMEGSAAHGCMLPTGASNDADCVTPEEVSNGAVTFWLNDHRYPSATVPASSLVWKQTLGVDRLPMVGSKGALPVYPVEGTSAYVNKDRAITATVELTDQQTDAFCTHVDFLAPTRHTVTFRDGAATVCLPYELPLPEGVHALAMTDGATAFSIVPVEATTLEAYVPYVLEVDEATLNTLVEGKMDLVDGKTVQYRTTPAELAQPEAITEAGTVRFCGVMTPFTTDSEKAANAYTLQEGTWQKVTADAGQWMYAFGAYVTVE